LRRSRASPTSGWRRPRVIVVLRELLCPPSSAQRPMKRSVAASCLVLLSAVSLSAQRPQLPLPAEGTWTLWVRQPGGLDWPFRVQMTADGDSVTMVAASGLRLRGRVDASGAVLAGVAADKKTALSLVARWEGDSLVGNYKAPHDTPAVRIVPDRQRPASEPTRRTVHPTAFYRVVSAAPVPLAHLW